MDAKEFTRFPSIEGFAKSVKNAGFSLQPRVETIGLKIKLHGTNGGIRVKDGCVVAQSRNRDLPTDDPSNDNAGFGAWVAANADFFRAAQFGPEFIIFGEWAGAGVQDTDAVNMLPGKHFFVFAVRTPTGYLVEPDDIAVGFQGRLDNVHVLPWHAHLAVDMTDGTSLELAAEQISDMTDACGEEDPYIKRMFDVSGPGEGFVGYFCNGGPLTNQQFEERIFKAKTEAHRGRKDKRAATVKFKPSEANALVLAYATEPRFKQGLNEALNGELSRARTKEFIAWVCRDVAKEAADELAASGMEAKDITGSVAKAAAQWYLDRCKELA